MYGPNYVKLSRLFAVRLFSMSIPHYTALSPARPDPSWSNRHAITASIRLALTQARTATPTARDSNLGSGNHDMSRLSALAHLNDAPIHGLADVRLAYFQRILRVAPSPLAPRPQTTRGNTRCSRLGPRQWQLRHVQTTYTRVPKRCHGAPTHGLACRYAVSGLLPTDIGCGTLALAPKVKACCTRAAGHAKLHGDGLSNFLLLPLLSHEILPTSSSGQPRGGACARLTMARGAFSKFLGRSAFRFNLLSKTALSHIKTNSKPFSMTNTAISAA
jgi:hypothetical protein